MSAPAAPAEAALPEALADDAVETGPLQEGLTPRTLLVIFYGAFILMPASMYLQLVTGQSLIGPIHFIALILWVELGKITRRPLTTAEAFIVYAISTTAANQHLFYTYAIHPAYFRIDELTNQIIVGGTGGKTLAEMAPAWWAPGRDVVAHRSFLHAAWFVPLVISVAVWAFHFMADVSMGLLCRELFVKGERLPYPYAHPTADACKTLTQNRQDYMKVFTIAGFVGTLWGMAIYWPVLLGRKIVSFPIPWADFNHLLHRLIPGGILGISTSLVAFTGGFIVPFRMIVHMVIGGVAVQVVGNALAVDGGIFKNFIKGMSIKTTLVQQTWVWMSVVIGALTAAAIIPLVFHPKKTLQIFTGLRDTKNRLAGGAPIGLYRLLFLFVGSILFSVILFRILIPGFPWYLILPYALIWSLLFSLIDARAIGSAGYTVDPPYVREGMMVATGYQGVDAWFAPWPISLGAGHWSLTFKICELVRCKASSYIKAALLAVPVGMVANFIYMSIFWSIAPIPSGTYPYTKVVLPQWVRSQIAWIATTTDLEGPGVPKVTEVFRWDWILLAFAAFVALYLIGRLIKKDISLIGLGAGMVAPLPVTMALLVGGLAAKVVARKVGPENYKKYRNVMVAGLVVGEGVVVGLTAAIAALKNSLVGLPQ